MLILKNIAIGVHLYLSVIENLVGLVASTLSLVRTVVFVLLSRHIG